MPLPPPLAPSSPPAAQLPPFSGVLVLDKPDRISSAGLLNRLKRLIPRGTKIGHAGTLDPFATGVLLALVGRATKRCEELMGSPKGYMATVKLGATTETLDPESAEVVVAGEPPSEQTLLDWCAGLRGEVEQMPPVYSALKVKGRPAYALARSGQAVELQPRRVQVYDLKVTAYAYPFLTLQMEVGRGFYVRALARDLGTAMGSAGYLTQLRRTRVGAYGEADAIAPDLLTADNISTYLRS